MAEASLGGSSVKAAPPDYKLHESRRQGFLATCYQPNFLVHADLMPKDCGVVF